MAIDTMRGLNLGGWLVIEKWITPSLFKGSKIQDEYNLCLTQEGREAVKNHHQSFIKEADFKWLHDHGFSAVRLPIGYWIFDDQPPYVGHLKEVDWCVKMCNRYNLKLILDLHALIGSQNGKFHSGRAGSVNWLQTTNKLKTTGLLIKLALRYQKQSCFYGLSVANEPKVAGGIMDYLKLISFYRFLTQKLQPILSTNQKLIFSDSFNPRLMTWLLPKATLMDSHFYQCFEAEQQKLNLQSHIKLAQKRQSHLKHWGRYRSIIIGEWSAVLPASLTNSLPEFKSHQLTRDYFDAQIKAMDNNCLGHFYWTYKTETNNYWNLKYLICQKIVKTKG